MTSSSEQLRSAIQLANGGDPSKFQDTVTDVLNSKLSAALDDRKLEVASGLFPEDEEISGE